MVRKIPSSVSLGYRQKLRGIGVWAEQQVPPIFLHDCTHCSLQLDTRKRYCNKPNALIISFPTNCKMSSVELGKHFATQHKRSSESRTPIIGMSSDESYQRHKHNVNRSTTNLSSLIAIKQYLPSNNKKMNLKSISRKKQFVSEEFTVDNTVDKYSQLESEEFTAHNAVDKYSQLDDNELVCKPVSMKKPKSLRKPKSLKKPKSLRKKNRLDDTEKTYETLFIGKHMMLDTIDDTERTELMEDFVFDDRHHHPLEPLAWKAISTVSAVAEAARDFSPNIYMVPLFPVKRQNN